MRRSADINVRRTTGSILLGILVAASTSAAQTERAVTANAGTGASVVREFRDPASGARWLVVRNTEDPAGPGRLILADIPGRQRDGLPHGKPSASSVRPGDSVAVEEHTAAVDISLEAIAIDRAAIGSLFRARLKIGGKVVRAVAIAPGRAALAPSIITEAQR